MILSHQLDNPIVKKHLLIIALGLFMGLSLYHYFNVSISSEGKSYRIPELIFSAIGGIILAYITYFISTKLDDLIPWKTQLANRFVGGIIILFITSFVFIYSLVFANIKLTNQADISEELYKNNLVKLGIILFIFMLIYNIIYFALYSYHSYSKLQIEAVSVERKQYELQLKALKSQLSSHFLFNNLNTISSLAFNDAKQTEDYIRGLSKVYNYTLHSYNTKLLSIREELEVVKSYLLLLRTRYGKALKYSINISEFNLKHNIPPLTLQMLVENAVKHNQITESNPLNIDVFEEDEYLVIKNNITEASKNISSFNIGLNNIKSRFQLLYHKNISILVDDNYTVKIPIIINDE